MESVSAATALFWLPLSVAEAAALSPSKRTPAGPFAACLSRKRISFLLVSSVPVFCSLHRQRHTFEGHTRVVAGVQFSPDGLATHFCVSLFESDLRCAI